MDVEAFPFEKEIVVAPTLVAVTVVDVPISSESETIVVSLAPHVATVVSVEVSKYVAVRLAV